MSLTTTSYKPFLDLPDAKGVKGFFRRINYSWWLKRIPMALLAAPAAYGVGAFAAAHLPLPFAILAGLAFESAYMGAIALADQQHNTKDRLTTFLWFLVNLIAVGASAIINTLYFAGGTYAAITPEAITHGVPMAVLNFFYGLLLHRSSIVAAEAQRAEQAEALKEFCPRCGKGFKSLNGLNGHKRYCK